MGSEYDRFHQNRTNLVIHVFAVPAFVIGVVAAVWFALEGRALPSVAFAALPFLSLALQGAGHKKEPVPPLPFTGPANFVARIFAEQFVRFPLFVLSGKWARAMRDECETD